MAVIRHGVPKHNHGLAMLLDTMPASQGKKYLFQVEKLRDMQSEELSMEDQDAGKTSLCNTTSLTEVMFLRV